MDTPNQRHLIERAAARLRQPTAEAKLAPAALAPAAPAPAAPGIRTTAPLGWQSLGNQEQPRRHFEDKVPDVKPIAVAALSRAGLIDWGDAYSRGAEEFRIIQNKILRQSFGANGSAPPERSNLVMVTSALKGEGKSFTAINLAGEVAHHRDRRVLLIDADPTPGGLREALGLSSAPGLLDMARAGGPTLAEVTAPTEEGHWDVIPLGKTGKGSGELLASRRMCEMIDEIGRRYADRLIIVDTPSCLSSSVPHSLANVMGQIVFVVAANSTQQADVEAALDLVRACPHISLLLNKIPLWSTHSFGSYSYATG